MPAFRTRIVLTVGLLGAGLGLPPMGVASTRVSAGVPCPARSACAGGHLAVGAATPADDARPRAILVGGVLLEVATDGAATPLIAEAEAEVAGMDAAASGLGALEEVAQVGDEAATEAADLGGEAANCNSFVAGTPVLLASGKTIPIEKVKVGTRVKSVDQYHPSSKPVASTVVGLIRHSDADLYRLVVDHTTIEATGNHPFFVRGTGWVKVRDLRAGMVLEEYSGRLVHLHRITREVSPAITVYNFEVAGTHTYFAGQAEVLVHNCGDLDSISQSGQRQVSEDGLSRAGQEFEKHANELRESVTGNAAAKSAAGQDFLDDILTHPGTVTRPITGGNFAGGVYLIAPSGFGAAVDASGAFQYFGVFGL